MKKLALIVMMGVMASFMAAGMTSADDHHWWGIQGTYAMTGVGTCINSPGGFTGLYTPQGQGVLSGVSNNFSGSNLFTGTWTFERHGNGQVQGHLFGTATYPYPVPNASSIDFSFNFTYSVTQDGTITAVMDEDSYLATFITGPTPGKTFKLKGFLPPVNPPADISQEDTATPDPLSFEGRVSTDHKTITLDSKNQVQRVRVYATPDGTGTPINRNYQICNVGRVLIRVGE
jgi:hypothetical protein